jgi:hypothetical protein
MGADLDYELEIIHSGYKKNHLNGTITLVLHFHHPSLLAGIQLDLLFEAYDRPG